MVHSSLLAVFAVSMFSLVAVSVDRCWAVCFPVTYHVSGTSITKIAILSCWICGIFVGFLPSFWRSSENFDGRCDLRVIAELSYLLIIHVAIAIVSTLVIIILYFRIYWAILEQVRREKKIKAVQCSQSNSILRSQSQMRQKFLPHTSESSTLGREIKSAITLAMIVGTFIILWTPGITSLCVIAITQSRYYNLHVLELSAMLVHLNSAIDPLIYAYRMRHIREALHKLFKCKSSEEINRSGSMQMRAVF